MHMHHPREKVGRNAPCPCGSGKKYKQCCLGGSDIEPPESPWQEQHEASDRLTNELMRFVKQRFAGDLEEAWQDFNQEEFPRSLREYPGEEQIFLPYFFFDWDPAQSSTLRARKGPGVIARTFLVERARRLGELERSILDRSIEAPVSFYEVLHCEPGHGFRLRDVLIGEEAEVEEHSGSMHVQVGDILYGQLCHLPHVTAMSRMAPIGLRPDRKPELVELRARLRRKLGQRKRPLDGADLIRFAEIVRTEYLIARDARLAPPVLNNTDGERVEMHTLRYHVGSAQVAFDALAPLAFGAPREDLLEAAEMDADGVLLGAEIPWIKPGNTMHKSWDNTILGHLKIEGQRLVVEVNSANRARIVRQEIEKRLGMLAVLESTETRSQAEMLEQARKNREARQNGDAPEEPAPDPEAQEMVRTMLQEHADSWVDTPIPALRGRTPRQAVADPDGREAVEGLLLEWERRNREQPDPVIQSFDVGSIRRNLGL